MYIITNPVQMSNIEDNLSVTINQIQKKGLPEVQVLFQVTHNASSKLRPSIAF